VALSLLTVLRKIDSLVQLDEKHGEAIRRLTEEIALLKDRVTSLETRDEVLIARAEGAASTAAALAASTAISDLARRIGAMEERDRNRTLLPPPTPDRA
jgi:transcription elongation GreA/GreB family factor